MDILKTKYNVGAQVMFMNWWNDTTCKLHDEIETLHNKGAHSVANEKQCIMDSLDDMARDLGIIQ